MVGAEGSESFHEADRILGEYGVKPPFIHKGFHARFYPVDLVQLIWNEWGKYAGHYYKLHITTLHENYWDLYYLPEEFNSLRNHYLERLRKKPAFLKKHYLDWKKSCKRLESKMRALHQALPKSDFSPLFKTYQACINEYLFEYALAAPVQEAFGFQPEQWINPEIESYCRKYQLDFNETAATLTSPVVHSFINEEEIELLRIALDYQKKRNDKRLHSLSQKHQSKWFWLQNNYADIKELPAEFFEKRAMEFAKWPKERLLKELKHRVGVPKSAAQKKKSLWKRFNPTNALKRYVKITELFSEMQDVRKSFVLRANHYGKRFLERVAQEFNQSTEALWYYSHRELMEAIEKKKFLPPEEIGQRKKMIAAVASRKEKVVLSGEEAQYFFRQLQEELGGAVEVKGLVAQTGKVEGRVKIVLKSHDLLKVGIGDILVASMTRPEMTPAMTVAAAFVTDEGGITSHAAIVAREMKKPCVIGTKIATKIFKDGDWVEVDANNGIVRKRDKEKKA